MRTVRTRIYKFNELSKEAQNFAIKKYRENYETELDGFVESSVDHLATQGFKNAELRYCLSYSQGDGLSFSADLNIEQLLKEFKPDIKTSVYNVVINNIYHSCKASTGHYAFGSGSDINIYFDNLSYKNLEIFVNDFDTFVVEKYLSLCTEFQNNAYTEIEHQSSDEYITDSINANEYEYLQNGTQY